jgi:hypothetical protein
MPRFTDRRFFGIDHVLAIPLSLMCNRLNIDRWTAKKTDRRKRLSHLKKAGKSACLTFFIGFYFSGLLRVSLRVDRKLFRRRPDEESDAARAEFAARQSGIHAYQAAESSGHPFATLCRLGVRLYIVLPHTLSTWALVLVPLASFRATATKRRISFPATLNENLSFAPFPLDCGLPSLWRVPEFARARRKRSKESYQMQSINQHSAGARLWAVLTRHKDLLQEFVALKRDSESKQPEKPNYCSGALAIAGRGAAILGRSILTAVMLSAPVFAVTIDSGMIPLTVNTDGHSDVGFWNISLGSTGNFNISFIEEGITASPGCTIETSGCPAGTTLNIVANSTPINFGAGGSGVIGGIYYPTLVLGAVGVDTRLMIATDPFTITGVGSYLVPFTLTGHLQAAVSVGSPLLLSEDISGIGSAQIIVTAFSQGRFYPSTISYTISAPTPEPATQSLMLISCVSMLLVGIKRRLKV